MGCGYVMCTGWFGEMSGVGGRGNYKTMQAVDIPSDWNDFFCDRSEIIVSK